LGLMDGASIEENCPPGPTLRAGNCCLPGLVRVNHSWLAKHGGRPVISSLRRPDGHGLIVMVGAIRTDQISCMGCCP
jgi:hypothetical protein